METKKTIRVSNREIALMAFDRLRRQQKTDAALRLAGCMLRYSSISLGIGDTDWDIETAIEKCGGELGIGRRYTAHFHFNYEREMEEEEYQAISRELYGE